MRRLLVHRGVALGGLALLFLALLLGCASLPSPGGSRPAWSAGVGDAEWWNSAIFYEIFVRSFLDTDGDGIGDLRGVEGKLDYLQGLGVTAHWLMPINPSPSYHGYDVTDFGGVNPDYGTLEDFQSLVANVHNRGMRLIVDLALNHTSSRHPWFVSSSDPASAYRSWYVWSDSWKGIGWHRDSSCGYNYARFGPDLPDLNLDNPAVVEQMHGIARLWLVDRNVDGFRLDAVRHLIEEDGRLDDTPATFEFLAGFARYCKSIKPDCMLVGEAWQGSVAAARYTTDGDLDQVFSFDLSAGIVSAARIGPAGTFTRALQGDMDVFQPGRNASFIANHDQERTGSQLGGDLAAMRLAAALLLTAPGTPFLYYGEEIGMKGRKPDQLIRTPMQWSPTPNGGFTTGTPWERVNDDAPNVNVQGLAGQSDSLLSTYRALIALRRQHPALQVGQTAVLPTGSASVVAFMRRSGDDVVLIIVNLADSSERLAGVRAPADLLGAPPLVIEPLWGAETAATLHPEGDLMTISPALSLPPKAALIFRVAS